MGVQTGLEVGHLERIIPATTVTQGPVDRWGDSDSGVISLFAVDSEVLNLLQWNGLVLTWTLINRFVCLE